MIGKDIINTSDNILILKKKLEDEKIIRKRKEEYETLSKSINKFAPKHQLQKYILLFYQYLLI